MDFALKPLVSVIICTYNPRQVLFDWALSSIEAQTLERDQFELIVVDNCSTVPLKEVDLRALRTMQITLVREPKLGLTHARCAAISKARADLLVFVDDDNFLLPNYLEQAIAIAAGEPEIGHFGGIAMPLHEEPITAWQRNFLPILGVRDNGPKPIVSYENKWGEWEPIGAGMVSRRAIAEAFIEMVRTHPLPQLLGRRGSAFMSGEDTLFARIASGLGYACAYQPSLKLFHYIRRERLRFTSLTRIIMGHGRSYVILEELSRRPIAPVPFWRMVWELGSCFVYHYRKEGFPAGLIQWFWDIGSFLQRRKRAPAADFGRFTQTAEQNQRLM